MNRAAAWWLGLMGGLLVLLFGLPVLAHQRSVSYSSWQLDREGARVQLRVSRLDETAMRGKRPLAELAPGQLRLFVDGQRCPAGPAVELRVQAGWRAFEWRVRCPPARRAYRVESDLLFDAIGRHLHFAELCDGAGCREVALGSADRTADLAAVAAPRGLIATVARYVPIGIAHIGSGLDHLAFLLALVLLARRLRPLLVLATGFTVGHSLSLSLAVLGQVRPAAATIEALIGLSVAMVAVEAASQQQSPPPAQPTAPKAPLLFAAAAALVGLAAAPRAVVSTEAVLGVALLSACYFTLGRSARRPDRLRLGVTGLFGLIHGFGFATVLGHLRLGPGQLGAALCGFNLGVEIGQIALLSLAVATLALLARYAKPLERRARELGMAGAVAAGTFWFLTRTLG